MIISDILKQIKTIAVVGLSDKPERPSWKVADYLKKQGYRIIPVNPNISVWQGEKAYSTIREIPKRIIVDAVDIFRKSEEALFPVQDAVKREVKLIWLQEGIINEEARQYAEKYNIPFIMNACMMKAHRKITPLT